MTIRSKLTTWYASIMFVSLLVMGFLMHHQFSTETLEDPGDTNDFGEAMEVVLLCAIPAGILALGGGWWLMRQSLSPVASLTHAAEQINERNLARPLPRSHNGDELDRLAEVLNAMNARLNDSFLRIREFTLHASHELKTPLTVLRGEAEMALQEGAITAAERERCLSQLDEFQRLTHIVDGLTLLAKADAGEVKLKSEPVRFDELVREIYADTQVLAQPSQIRVELRQCESTTLRGDAHRLRQLLLNLVDNAVKYNQRGGSIDLTLTRTASNAEFVVTNTGPGIPPEALPRVFDRFFRGDPAHADTNGCGLGLSIAQWIVTAHSGKIGVTSELGKVTKATVNLPLAPQAN